MNDHAQAMTLSERADAIEEHMMHELEHFVIKSALFNLADGKVADDTASLMAGNPGQYLLMKEDPRPQPSQAVNHDRVIWHRPIGEARKTSRPKTVCKSNYST
jgi:hypothetical protein